MTARSLIVFNPSSGKGRAAQHARELRTALEERNRHVDVLFTESDGNVFERVDEEGYEEIFVVGGDGSAHAAANGLRRGTTPVVFCGLGTVNVLALEQALPREPRGLADLAVAGRDIDVPLLQVRTGQGGEVVELRGLLFIEAGFLARVVAAVNAWRKRTRRHGKLEFVLHALRIVPRSFGRPLRTTIVAMDGTLHERTYANVIASKVRRYAGTMTLPIPPRHSMSEEGFWFVGMRTRTPLGHLFLLTLGALGAWPLFRRLLVGRLLDVIHARSLRVDADEGPREQVHVDAESEAAGGRPLRLPLDVDPAGASLRLRVPLGDAPARPGAAPAPR